MRRLLTIVLLFAAMPTVAETPEQRRARILAPTTDFTVAERFESLQGGSGTNRTRLDTNAFSQPSGALDFEARADFFIGNGVFDRPWIAAPSSTTASDGLGPMFNARSCQGCHIKDGRGHPPGPDDETMVSMLFAVSDQDGAPDAVLGAQFQDQAIVGHRSEGRVRVSYASETFTYPDGSETILRRPSYETDAELAPGVSLNPRIAPPMIGLGLLEAIADADLAARADPDDRDGDGVSGRLARSDGAVGRFGWKAMEPTLRSQSATAFSNDMGLSTWERAADWGDCTAAQPACRGAFHGGDAGGPEVADALLDFVTFYAAHLAVPARRAVNDLQVLRGKQVFHEVECIACHVPKHATARDAPDGLGGQLIWPYTDLLLHDMGPDLADATPTGDRGAAEWRTPPLWGIGLTATVSGHTFFLHDGRARSLEEAILWHGGEGAASRDAFVARPAVDRAALIRFLESL
ncbi:MAG: di-heme oxidoredictase family protein [Pseudomonadota bacterium]